MDSIHALKREYVGPSKININDQIVVDGELYTVTSLGYPLRGRMWTFGIRFSNRERWSERVAPLCVPSDGSQVINRIKK